jgi:hypothetical protein
MHIVHALHKVIKFIYKVQRMSRVIELTLLCYRGCQVDEQGHQVLTWYRYSYVHF